MSKSNHPTTKALDILTAQCDGAVSLDHVGLNKIDAKSLRQYGADDLDHWALKLIKYSRQLGDALTQELKDCADQHAKRSANGEIMLTPISADRFSMFVPFKMKDEAKKKAFQATGVRTLDWNHPDAPKSWSVHSMFVAKLVASGDFIVPSWFDLSTLPTDSPEPASPFEEEAPAIPAPALTATHKDAPLADGFDYRPYQSEGADQIIEAFQKHGAAVLADEMGLGKTLQALTAAFALGVKAFVIPPAGVRSNWAEEVVKFFPTKKVYVHKAKFSVKGKKEIFGDAASNIVDDAAEADVLIASYAGCRSLVVDNEDPATNKYNTMKKVPTPRFVRWLSKAVVIADEAQKMKNPKAQQSQAAYAIMRAAKYKLPMTGTPITNRPEEFWGMLCAAGLNREVADTKSEFLERYVYSCQYEDLNKILTNATWWIRRLKKDVEKDLPEKQQGDLIVEMHSKFHKEYNQKRALLQDKSLVLKALTEMQTVANAAKVEPMCEIIADDVDCERPVGVQCTRTEALFELEKELLKKGIKVVTITGNDNDTSRSLKKKAFQSGEYDVVLTTIAEGITLTRAEMVYLLDIDWSPAVINQREDRFHRIGLDHPILVRRVICASIDRHKVDVVTPKQAMIAAVVDGGDNQQWDESNLINEVVVRLQEEI